jgi:hypothetical protein
MAARMPDPTARHLSAWRALVRLAAAASAAPRAATGDLAVAVKTARKCVLPIPPEAASNPFIRLHRRAEQFARETAAGRDGLANELATLAAECAAILTRPAPPGSPLRPRADLDG